MLQKHPGKWVAMGAAGILSTGTSLNEMLSVVKGRGLDTSEFAIYLSWTRNHQSCSCDNGLVRRVSATIRSSAMCLFPRLRAERQDVAFLFDTGAQRERPLHPHRIHEVAGRPLPASWVSEQTREGVGGLSPYFLEPALLVFEDGTQIRIYGIDLRLATPTKATDSYLRCLDAM